MKKKRKQYQTVQPAPESAPEPEKKVITISSGQVQVGDIVTRRPITLAGVDVTARSMQGRVVWVHPLGRFHVVEFGKGKQAVRESFMGVSK